MQYWVRMNTLFVYRFLTQVSKGDNKIFSETNFKKKTKKKVNKILSGNNAID